MATAAVTDFSARTGTPIRLIKGVLGALAVLGVYERRHQIRYALVYLLQRLGVMATPKKKAIEDQEPPKVPATLT